MFVAGSRQMALSETRLTVGQGRQLPGTDTGWFNVPVHVYVEHEGCIRLDRILESAGDIRRQLYQDPIHAA